MWKPSKKVLFVLMLASGVTGGISLSLVDWSTLKNYEVISLYHSLFHSI
jgi:hypothetical protein